MSETEEPNPELESVEYLTPEKAAELLFLSFRFSQGDQETQAYIYEWIHMEHPYWKIKTNDINKISEILVPKITKIASDPSESIHENVGQDNYVFTEQLKKFTDCLQKHVILPKKTILHYLIYGITSKDNYHLCKKMIKGRKRKNTIVDSNTPPVLHPFSSHFVDFVIKQSSTGSPEYRAMFKQIGDEFKKLYRLHMALGNSPDQSHDENSEESEDEHTKFSLSLTRLIEVITIYNQNHPGAEVDFEAWVNSKR